MIAPRRIFATLVIAILSLAAIGSVSAGIVNELADRVLGQHGLTNNMVDFGGPTSLYYPAGVWVDRSATPNRLYIVDTNNNRVLGYANAEGALNGAIPDLLIGETDFFSSVKSEPPTSASLNLPVSAVTDADGNLYIAEWGSSRVVEYDNPFGRCGGVFPCISRGAQRVFGQGGNFTTDGCNLEFTKISADTLCEPAGVTVDSAGNLYVADARNNRVLEYNTPTRLAGPGSNDTTADLVFGQNGSFSSRDCDSPISPDTLCLDREPPPSTAFNVSLAVDGSDNLWVPDQIGRVLMYKHPLAPGGGTPGTPGSEGDTTADFSLGVDLNGNPPDPFDTCMHPQANSFCTPSGVAFDNQRNIYVRDEDDIYQTADSLNYGRVLGFNDPFVPSSSSCPGCGDAVADFLFGQSNFTNAACTESVSASYLSCSYPDFGGGPIGLASDSSGALFAADSGDHRVLRYDTPVTNQSANVVLGQVDFSHQQLNLLGAKSLNVPQGIAIDTSVSLDHVYVADEQNNRVLGWLDAAGFVNGAPADLVIGQPDFSSTAVNNSGFNDSTFADPEGVAVDGRGNLYVADTGDGRVVEYSSPFAACASFPCVFQGTTPNLVFGLGLPSNSSCPSGASADTLFEPSAVAVDPSGNIWISDTLNNRVLEYDNPLDPGGGTPGKPGSAGDTTADLVVGQNGPDNFDSCTCGNPIDGSLLCTPRGIAFDTKGNLYVADGIVFEYSDVLRKRQPRLNVAPDMIFGGKTCSDGPDCLFNAGAVAVDSSDNLFVADTGNHRVLEYFNPSASGGGTPGKPGASGDRTADLVLGANGSFTPSGCNGTDAMYSEAGAASAASLCFPSGLAFDSMSNLYVADTGNHRVLAFNYAPIAEKLIASPGKINFGRVPINGTRSREVVIKNFGGAKAKFPVDVLSESVAAPFAVKKQCIGQLRPGQTCDIVVTFAPTDSLAHSAVLSISDNATGSPQMVQLSGMGFTSPHNRKREP